MLIDRFLPTYDTSKRYAAVIHASPAAVYSALKESDVNASTVIRTLFTLRGLPALFSREKASRRKKLTIQDITRSGFMLLSEKPDQEIVIGVVGKFWRLSGNICKTVTPEHFADFNDPDFAKAAWNFFIKTNGDGSVELSTETRIHCNDLESKKKFKRYWRLIGPFSGLIRKEMLKIVKKNAENKS